MQKAHDASSASAYLRGLSPRSAAFALIFWVFCGGLAQVSGLFGAMSRVLTEPVEFAARAAAGAAPRLDEKLAIFNLDDSTFAYLRKPALSGKQWAGIVRTLTAAKPRAIVTTHMFGTGEMQENDGALARALSDAKAQGVDLVAGVFAYPGEIKYRESLPPQIFSFIKQTEGLKARSRSFAGWKVYGPDPDAATMFTHLGHQGYEGDGRAAMLIAVEGGVLVPHLGLAVARNLSTTATGISADGVDVPLDSDGRTRINLLPAQDLASRTKSLKALLKDVEDGVPARYVAQGDVVLLLMDMYTGKVNFAPTPRGLAPGGYLWAALLNSVLSRQWIRETAGVWAAVPFAPLIGAVLGIALEGWVFGVGFGAMTFAVAAAGLASFVYRGIATPWMPTMILLGGAAGTLFAMKQRVRLSKARGRQIAQDRESARLQAIVRTAQMFAHDVRKPFSLLNMALNAMKRETNPARAGALLAGLAPELARAMATVEGMIKDIMEIDSTAKLELRETDLNIMLRQAMKDVLSVRTKADVLVSFRLRHTLPASVDAARLTRAVSNIMDNAIQATGGKGRLWIDTEEVLDKGRCYIQVVVGNSGSYIPPEDRARVFDAFFTRGKKDGTGLGLAIAHKIVTGHGGRIWCDSAEEIGTEFFMTLPVAEETPMPAAGDATSTNDATQHAASTQHSGIGASANEKARAADRHPLVATAPSAGNQKRIYAVIDDNPFVLDAWSLVAGDETILTFASPEDFLGRVDADPGFLGGLTAVVTDFNFESSTMDGIDLARRIKARSPTLPIFLSTDGDVEYLPGDGIDARIAKDPTPFPVLLKSSSGA